MEKEKLERHVTVIGRVVVHEGNDVNKDCLEILTDEGVYAVELDYVGEQLLDFIDQDIKATGFLNKYNDGSLRILLDDYELLEDDIYIENELGFPDDYSFEDDEY